MDFREAFVKKYLTEEEINTLIKEAIKVSKNALLYFTNIHVGVCILTKDGKYYGGCNIETINLKNTIHAEESAIANCVSNGSKELKAIAIYHESTDENPDFLPVCGSCRQLLSEFCLVLPIILVHKKGALIFDVLCSQLPLVPHKQGTFMETLNKFEIAALNANNWILKDYYHTTRDQMRKLLHELNFDEIINRFSSRISFKANGIIKSIFQSGSTFLNYITWQLFCQAFSKFIKAEFNEKKLPKIMIAHDNGAYCKNLADLGCATLVKFDIPIFKGGPLFGSKLLIKGTIEGLFDRDFVIHISDSEGSGEITISFVRGDTLLIDVEIEKLIQQFFQEENKLLDLSNSFDYKTLRLYEIKKNNNESEEQMITISMNPHKEEGKN